MRHLERRSQRDTGRLLQGACGDDRFLWVIVGHPVLVIHTVVIVTSGFQTETDERFSFTGYKLYSIGTSHNFNYCRILLDRRPHRAGVVSLGEMTPAPLLLRTQLTA